MATCDWCGQQLLTVELFYTGTSLQTTTAMENRAENNMILM